MRFTKMHGLGNDYVYVNCFEEKIANPAKLAQIVSDRHRGIGADGLILICPSSTADVRMRMFNADGSEAEMCGNGIRCVTKYTYEHKLAEAGGAFAVPGQQPFPASLNIETGNEVLTVGLMVDDRDKVQRVCVNMGQPVLTPRDIPVNLSGEKVIEQSIEILGQELLMTCVSMGNPHAIFFCDNVELIKLEKLGPAIENHSLFPDPSMFISFRLISQQNLPCGHGSEAAESLWLVAAVHVPPVWLRLLPADVSVYAPDICRAAT